MKKWKKVFSLMLILIFAAVLSACGSNDSGSDEGADGTEDKKKLKVVTNAAYAPFEYLEGDKVVGFDADLIEALAEEAGYDIEIEHTGFDTIFLEIENKNADLSVSAITINDDRKQSYDFSVPYYLSTNKILVKEDSGIESAEDLKDKVVAVQIATTGQEAVEKIIGKNNPNLKKFETINVAIQELLSGGADAVVADNLVLEQYQQNNPDQKLKVIADDTFEAEYFGILFPKGSELKSEFDEALNTLFDNGKFAEIYKEWFEVEPDIENLKAQQ